MDKQTKTFLIITTVIILIYFMDLSSPSNLYAIGIKQSTYSTTKSCSVFMSSIKNPSLQIPFDWQYTKTQNRCIIQYQKSGKGCKISYYNGKCAISTQQDNCALIYGDGSKTKLNFILLSNNFNDSSWAPVYLDITNEFITWMKETDPFSTVTTKFNIYRMPFATNMFTKNFEGSEAMALVNNKCNLVYNQTKDKIVIIDRFAFGAGWAIKEVASCNNKRLCIHELGHTFDLRDDYTTNNYMSYSVVSDHFDDYQKIIILKSFQ